MLPLNEILVFPTNFIFSAKWRNFIGKKVYCPFPKSCLYQIYLPAIDTLVTGMAGSKTNKKSTRLREFHTSFSNDSWAFGEVPWFCHQGTIARNVSSDPFAQISIKCPLWDDNFSMIKATEWWAGYREWESIKCQINILPPPPSLPHRLILSKTIF